MKPAFLPLAALLAVATLAAVPHYGRREMGEYTEVDGWWERY